jgi:flagellar biosynthesis chaperone FliJ
MEKEENILHDIIKEKSKPGSELDKYINEREKLNEEHVKSIKECREEKKSIKEVIYSNIQKPSEIAQELVEETGPDYTGGDD